MASKTEQMMRRKLREDFVSGMPNTLTDEALLELLLSYAPNKDRPGSLAHRLLKEFGSLDNVLSMDFHVLCSVEGVRPYTATLLKLAGHLRTHKIQEEQSDDGKSQPVASEYQSNKRQTFHGRSINRRKSGLFTNSILEEAIELLPSLPDTTDLDIIKAYLREKRPFSALATRDRYVRYIVNRMFPDGRGDPALQSFARDFSGCQELREVCFYRFCKAEPLMVAFSQQMLLPAIGYGHIERFRIREYLAGRYPDSKAIDKCARAVIDTLVAGGIIKSDRRQISFSYREPLLASLAYVIHSEFPTPGMYEICELESNGIIRAMLWNPDSLLTGLYELRNHKIISKISEIDGIRQFTIRYRIDEVVDKIESL